ncbi:MAG: DUF4340 domain-containing protein [Synechococcales bacterium]|nr:DUF4340 domain-containing protein [Synechococcales bacterium]
MQRTSIFLFCSAILLGLGVYGWATTSQPNSSLSSSTQESSESQPIFTFKEEEIQALTVKTLVSDLTVEKNPQPGKVGWQMTRPDRVAASDAAVAYLTDLLTTAKSDRTLSVKPDRKVEFGLDQPLATVEIQLANQQKQTLVLGKPNFNRTALYAIANPPQDANQDLAVLLVPTTFESAVTRSLAEWKQTQVKPSPSPTTSASPTVLPEISPTPAPEPTIVPTPEASPVPSPSPSPAGSPSPSP